MNIFQFNIFQIFPELIHGVATAEFGNMSFRYGSPKEVRENRKTFFNQLHVPESHVIAAQLEHGHKIYDVTGSDRGKGILLPEDSNTTDILVTSIQEAYLFLVVADCLALFFYEPVKRVIALAHAGWKGVEQQVPTLTVTHMVEKYGCNPKYIRIGMSPALQSQSAIFPSPIEQESLPGWKKYISRSSNGFCSVDTPQYAYDQLMNAGILPDNIERSMIDTRTSPEYFSHRRSVEIGSDEGRFGCLIGLKKID